MPWSTPNLMSVREEFVALASQPDSNRRELCRRFGISPQTGYKWIQRHAESGKSGLGDRSRRPHNTPAMTAPDVQSDVVALRQKHPAWGGRKIARRLQDLGYPSLAPSTITSILHRHNLIHPDASAAATAWKRFEHDAPNALWQIDFKGHFDTSTGRCHPLTLLDDHSRFNLVIQACASQKREVVQESLTQVFRRYGLPIRINTDNGAPWGSPAEPGQISGLGVWLIRLGIRISHSRPYHPQTNGKDERFHRSLKAEVLNGRSYEDLAHAQSAFDHWRAIYNHQRPHQALGMDTPDTRYRVSERAFPELLAPIEYGPDDEVIIPTWDGQIRFRGRRYKLSNALINLPVAIRPMPGKDGFYEVYFMHHKLREIDLHGD